MRFSGVYFFIAAAILMVIAPIAPAQQTAQLTVAYQWSNGTVAPQYYEQRRITIRSDGAGEILVKKGLEGINGKERKASFAPDPAKLRALIDYLHSNHWDVPPQSAPQSSPVMRPRPGDGVCRVDFVVRGDSYGGSCTSYGQPLLEMIKNLVPAAVMQQLESAGPLTFAPPMSFGGGEPDYATVSITLNEDFSYELHILHETIAGPRGPATSQQGRWSYDASRSVVTLHPNDPALSDGSLALGAGMPLRATLQVPGMIAVRLSAETSTPAPIPDVRPPPPQKSPDPFPAQHRDHRDRDIAIQTADGHWLTAADGGGYGGPNSGPGAVALHSDATRADVWERFDWVWLDEAHGKFALRTMHGTYVTAVNGGGIGGPNDGRSPFHTDATRLGVDEIFRVEFDGSGKATLRTRKGYYVTAVNGGGYGGPNTVPVHTDATAIGPWETFTVVSATR